MFRTVFENVRSTCPLIHNITNYVTVNDCANMVLACGGFAHHGRRCRRGGGHHHHLRRAEHQHRHPEQPHHHQHAARPAKRPTQLGHPVVLDPVGAGASRLRTDTAYRLLRGGAVHGHPRQHLRDQDAGLRCRHHQGRGCRCGRQGHRGKSGHGAVAFAKAFAAQTGAVVAITGAIDIVADGGTSLLHPQRPPNDEQPSPARAASSRP